MLTIIVTKPELYDEINNRFIQPETHVLTLEHSLVSLSKWESFWEIPFLGKTEKTNEQTIDYIKKMVLSPEDLPEIFEYLSDDNIKAVNDYIDAKMTATFFLEKNIPPSSEIITAEVIYYWMIALNIPFECQDWHLNRLITLVKVCNEMNSPKKKNTSLNREQLSSRAALNAARKAAAGSNG